MLGMQMEPQLQVREAGCLLRALERLEKLLLAAEAERMSPCHHQLMAEARDLGAAIGSRLVRLGGGAAAVRSEWRRPGRPDDEICGGGSFIAAEELAVLPERAGDTLMPEEQAEEQRRSWVYGNASMSNPSITRKMVDDAADSMRKTVQPRPREDCECWEGVCDREGMRPCRHERLPAGGGPFCTCCEPGPCRCGADGPPWHHAEGCCYD
jgi:hypothetical protein